jgi:hypothetical protein
LSPAVVSFILRKKRKFEEAFSILGECKDTNDVYVMDAFKAGVFLEVGKGEEAI